MDYGVFYLPTFYPDYVVESAPLYASLRAQARRAEALGFTSFWLAEHHFHGFGGMLPSPQVVIPALAAETRHLRFGTGVALLPFHNPLILAEDYATVDVLSGGRLDFGVGVGFQKLEADVLDAPLETARQAFYEHLEIILQAWTQERVTYEGRFHSYHDVCVLPKPLQRPHPPIWLAASHTHESFRWAGERGYPMLTIGFLHDVADLKERLDVYRAAYRAAGHPPGEERIVGTYHVYTSDDAAEARAVGARGLDWYQGAASQAQRLSRVAEETAYASHAPIVQRARALSFEQMQSLAVSRVIVGEPAACRETIAHLREELGFSLLLCNFALGGLAYDDILRSMDRFAEQVMER